MTPLDSVRDFLIDPIFHNSGAARALMPHLMMKDPVTTLCGHTYEHLQLQGYLRKVSPTCPLCRAPVDVRSLLPNLDVKEALAVLSDPGKAKCKNIEELTDADQIRVLRAVDEIQKRRAADAAKVPPIPDRLDPPQWCLDVVEPTVVNCYHCYGKTQAQ
jgi:hypothetical protein